MATLVDDGGDDGTRLALRGEWTSVHADAVMKVVAAARERAAPLKHVRLDFSGVTRFDTLGVTLAERLASGLRGDGHGVEMTGIAAPFLPLFEEVRRGIAAADGIVVPRSSLAERVFAPVGERVLEAGRDIVAFLGLFGQVTLALRAMLRPGSKLRPLSFIAQLDRVSLRAVPIMLLITFLIGAIIAQQGVFHFRKFGAETYVVDMVCILVLREIGVLLVAIMVAGRTGSAYTAELGSMKMREEIDALTVMGLDPVGVLVVPRLLALMVGLPLLTILGNFAAIGGGMLVASSYGGIPMQIFLQRFHEAVYPGHLWIGIAKAPFMALLIGMVACVEGLRVRGSAESLGEHTTASVVKSIFLVIVIDGLFAILFAWLDL